VTKNVMVWMTVLIKATRVIAVSSFVILKNHVAKFAVENEFGVRIGMGRLDYKIVDHGKAKD
jgi:hypothetical protein